MVDWVMARFLLLMPKFQDDEFHSTWNNTTKGLDKSFFLIWHKWNMLVDVLNLLNISSRNLKVIITINMMILYHSLCYSILSNHGFLCSLLLPFTHLSHIYFVYILYWFPNFNSYVACIKMTSRDWNTKRSWATSPSPVPSSSTFYKHKTSAYLDTFFHTVDLESTHTIWERVNL